VTGIAGGAIVTPLLGIVTDATGTQTAAFVAMLVIWVYMCLIFGKVSKTANESA
jgi:fucose permease